MMKKNKQLLFIIWLSASSLGFAFTPSTKFNVMVNDSETNLPLSNVNVRTTFQLSRNPFGIEGNSDIREIKKTDTNGFVEFEGKDCTESMGVTIFAENYYTGTGGFEFTKRNRILNRWEPWNQTIDIFLRKIKDPVPMISFSLGSSWKRIPKQNIAIGFDMVKGDFIKPYGTGLVADFNIIATGFKNENETSATYIVSFPNPMDGIQTYIPSEKMKYSAYKFPYQAPLFGYKSELKKSKIWRNRGGLETEEKEDSEINYLFRIRSKKMDDGTISGLYGYISGEFKMSFKFGLQFSYNLNPNPNSRSLEYNGTNLLKK